MSNPSPEPSVPRRPTPDDLAGIPACLDENSANGVHPGKSDLPADETKPDAIAKPLIPAGPTADQLAGIPVTATGKPDLTIRPWKRLPKKP